MTEVLWIAAGAAVIAGVLYLTGRPGPLRIARDDARDWLLLAYVLATLTEGATVLAAIGAGLWWLVLPAAWSLGVTQAWRAKALARIDGAG